MDCSWFLVGVDFACFVWYIFDTKKKNSSHSLQSSCGNLKASITFKKQGGIHKVRLIAIVSYDNKLSLLFDEAEKIMVLTTLQKELTNRQNKATKLIHFLTLICMCNFMFLP